jgi:predicted permease
MTAIDFTPDWTVIGYALVLAVLGAMAFTVWPSMRVWRLELLPSLKPGEQGIAAGRSRLSSTLAVVQIAFCVLLLTVAGLGLRALTLLDATDLGFDTERLLIVRVNTAGQGDTPERRLALLERLRERLAAVPSTAGVTHVGVVPPFFPGSERVTAAGAGVVMAERNYVGPGFFALLGAPPVAGREFTVEDDRRQSAIAIVNQRLADRLWPGESPIGRTLQYGGARRPLEVIAVVPNALFNGPSHDGQPSIVFVPEHLRGPGAPRATFYVRHHGPVETAAPALRAALRQSFPEFAVEMMTPIEQALADLVSPIRMTIRLMMAFAAGSLLIAAVGLYGVIAFNMRRRTREFGVRIALGASGRQVLGSVVREGALLTAIGLVAGFVLSAGAGSLMRGVLFGVAPTDPPTYAGVFALLAIVSLMASYLPARRASRVDPVVALRQE